MKIGNEPRLLNVTRETENISFENISDISKDILLDILKGCKTAPVYWQSADYVTFGLYTGGDNRSFVFADGYTQDWEHLQELRVFDNESELRVWRYGKKYYRRRIIDRDAMSDKSGNCLEQEVKLWGTHAEKEGQFIILQENRGMKLALPIKWEDRFGKGINVFVKERLYLKEDNDTGCVYISDRRFCSLCLANESEELIEVKL